MGEVGRGRRERKSGVSLLQLSPFFASIFPLFPQKRLILRLPEPPSRPPILVDIPGCIESLVARETRCNVRRETKWRTSGKVCPRFDLGVDCFSFRDIFGHYQYSVVNNENANSFTSFISAFLVLLIGRLDEFYLRFEEIVDH